MARCGCVSACSCIFDDLVEGDCIDVTVTGSGSAADPYIVTADLVLDTATDECLNCGVNGLALVFDPATDDCVNCGPSGIRLVIDPDTTQNLLSCGVNGLIANFVAVDSASIDFSGEGTAVSPLTAVVAAGVAHTHDGSGGGTSLVIGGVNEGGASVPTASSSQSIAMGDFANASIALGPISIGSGVDATSAPSAIGLHAIAVGSAPAGLTGARASGSSAVAIGGGAAGSSGASATGIDTIAVGRSAGTAGAASQTICIGASSQAHSGAGAIAIGSGVDATRAAQATAQGGIAIGACNAVAVDGARAAGVTSVAIGSGSGATAGARAAGTNSIAIGLTSISAMANNIAIGAFSQATTSTQVIAIGSGVNATAAPLASAQGAIAIGSSDAVGVNGARSLGISSIAIGSGTAVGGETGALASGTRSIAVGRSTTATSLDAVSIGSFANSAVAANTISIGSGQDVSQAASATGLSAIAIGSNDNSPGTGARATGAQSVAIGGGTAGQPGALGSGDESIAIGRTSTATATAAIAIGSGSTSAFGNAVALGDGVSTTNTGQVNIGTKRLFQGTPTTAPADADVINSQASLWLDEATYDFLLAYKARTSGGTIKTGGWNLGEWELYTTTLDQGGAITGITTDYSRQDRVGREIVYEFKLTLIDTGVAANLVTVSLPFTAVAPVGTVVGSGEIFDDSTGIFYSGVAYLASSTTIAFRLGNGTVTDGMGAAGGGFVDALDTDDTVSGSVTFEATT